MTRMNRSGLVVAAALVLLTSASAFAQESAVVTGQLQVTASVVPNCRLNAAALSFGAYDPLQRNATVPLTATTDLTLLCTRNTPATVSLDFGVNGTGGQERALGLAEERLRYQLFRDPARTMLWGTGGDAVSVGAATGVASPMTFPVYGSIFPAQEVSSGAYSDIITARVDF